MGSDVPEQGGDMSTAVHPRLTKGAASCGCRLQKVRNAIIPGDFHTVFCGCASLDAFSTWDLFWAGDGTSSGSSPVQVPLYAAGDADTSQSESVTPGLGCASHQASWCLPSLEMSPPCSGSGPGLW